MKQVRQFLDFLIYSNIFIGVCAVALAFTNQLTIEGDFHFDLQGKKLHSKILIQYALESSLLDPLILKMLLLHMRDGCSF